MMKVLLFSPDLYTIHSAIIKGFESQNYEIQHFDYRWKINTFQSKFNVHSRRLPFKYREVWNRFLLNKINRIHIEIFDEYKPDIVFIYNNELMLPETLSYFKQNNTKIIFYLGDSPYYTNTHDYYLSLLFHSDLIVSPDSFWISQLNLLGIENTTLDFFQYTNRLNTRDNHSSKPKDHDLIFIGMGYSHSWGYKRALFVNSFANLDIKVHGDRLWLRWLEFFPELKQKFVLKTVRYDEKYMNKLYSSAKIYPVDANPGLLNGIHVRIFDCINNNILPLPEYRNDIESVFKNTGLKIIRDYKKAEMIAQYYLDHEKEREGLVKDLQYFISQNFSPEVVVSRILDKI